MQRENLHLGGGRIKKGELRESSRKKKSMRSKLKDDPGGILRTPNEKGSGA